MSGAGNGAWQTPGPGTPERRASGPGRSGKGAGSLVTPAEEHLGDRLAALVDGELGHDSRERVLAHLATCDECRAEADEQRRLKNVFAAAAMVAPGPSAGLLARLQGLPGLDERDDGDGPLDGLRKVTLLPERSALAPIGPAEEPEAEDPGAIDPGGFRIHDFGRAGRPSVNRGRRFAFAAAGAFSMAAIALGGALPAEDASPTGRSEEPGSTAPAAARSSGTSGSDLGPGGGILEVSEGNAPFTVNAPVMLTSVHQPMRLRPTAADAPTPSATSSWSGSSLLGAPGKGSADH